MGGESPQSPAALLPPPAMAGPPSSASGVLTGRRRRSRDAVARSGCTCACVAVLVLIALAAASTVAVGLFQLRHPDRTGTTVSHANHSHGMKAKPFVIPGAVEAHPRRRHAAATGRVKIRPVAGPVCLERGQRHAGPAQGQRLAATIHAAAGTAHGSGTGGICGGC